MQSASEIVQLLVCLIRAEKREKKKAEGRPKQAQSRQALKRRAVRGGISVSLDERITGRDYW